MENRRAWNGALLRLLKLENDAFLAPLFLKQVRPKADRLDVLLAHYTSELLQAVKSLYHKDILYFGYIDDINLLTEIIQLRDEILL